MATVSGETTRSGLLTAGAGLALLGLFAPWLRSGSSPRSSFELLNLVQRLGFASGSGFEWGVRPWPFVPILIVSAVVASWSARYVAATVIGVVASLYVIAVAGAVTSARSAEMIVLEWGVWVSLAGAVVLLGASCWIAASSRSA